LNEFKVLAHVASEIDKLRQEQAAFLAAGRADNHPEYKHVCGIIRGLSYAERIIDDLVQRLEKADD
jgi:hypothetical protein